MKWNKIGLIYDLKEQDVSWLKSHAMMPLPFLMEDRIRVYFTGRHVDGRSRVAYIDVNKDNPGELIGSCSDPLLEVGKKGTFDDCGTVGTFVMRNEDKVYLYYNGYNVRNTVPWSNSIGLAVSEDGGTTFKKMFEGPIMDRNPIDPYFTITPCILKENGTWHMWYTSGTGWLDIGSRVEPVYNLKYATSLDGINWARDNIVSIEQSSPEECVARATVLKEGDNLRMWFIYRGSRDFRDGVDSYRIGYAESSIQNPSVWHRNDDLAGITPGPESYDDKMQAYPGVVDTGEKKYLFYNGNGFGAEGICCAELVTG